MRFKRYRLFSFSFVCVRVSRKVLKVTKINLYKNNFIARKFTRTAFVLVSAQTQLLEILEK